MSEAMFEQGVIWAVRVARGAVIVDELETKQRLAVLFALQSAVTAFKSRSAGAKDIIEGRAQRDWPALTLADIEREYNFPDGYLRGEAARDVTPAPQAIAAGASMVEDEIKASLTELLAHVEKDRALFVECHCVWSRPEDGSESEPLLDTLSDDELDYLASLDLKIERARDLLGGSDASRTD